MLAYDIERPTAAVRPRRAPLRLRNEVQLGFKQIKWIQGIDFVCKLKAT
ncbi:hypothetical protein [Streptomyces sp. NPDC001070]